MKITRVETRALRLPYKKPYRWAQGICDAAEVVLVCVHTDQDITGYGESLNSGSATSVQSLLQRAGELCLGQNPFEITKLVRTAYEQLFVIPGTGTSPRFGRMVLAGLDMALWDISGKAAGRGTHELLGGAVREHIQYFGFPQGESAEELAHEARQWAEQGAEVIYLKIGRGEALDLAIAAQAREAIGKKRLRLDANEAWDVFTASRMIRALAPFNVECIEQPTNSNSLSALLHVKQSSPLAIAADQIVATPEDVYAVCREQAADMIVLALHEAGGIEALRSAAAIAQVAGLNICLHGNCESGITTCATNQLGATLINLDDGNQYMNHLLREDIVLRPDLSLKRGRLPILPGPGLGFELNWDAIARAEEAHRTHWGL